MIKMIEAHVTTVPFVSSPRKTLRREKGSVPKVGEACGYRDRAVFFKAFKREVGMSPGAYRASSAR